MRLTISGEQYTENLLNFIQACQRHHGSNTKSASVHKLARLCGDNILPQRVNNWKRGIKRPIADYSYLAKIDPQKRNPYVLKAYLEGRESTDSFTRNNLFATIQEQSSSALVAV